MEALRSRSREPRRCVRGEKFGHCGDDGTIWRAGVLLRALIFKFEAWPHQIGSDPAISTTHPTQRLGSSPVKQVVEVQWRSVGHVTCAQVDGEPILIENLQVPRAYCQWPQVVPLLSPRSSQAELTLVLGRLVKFNLAERIVEHRRLEGSLEASWE